MRLGGEDGLRRPWSDVAKRRVSVLDLSGNRVEPARWRILAEATSAADYACDPVIFIRSAHGRDGKGGKRRKREREGETERGGEQREVCLALFPTKATRSYFAPLPLVRKRE